MKKKSGIVLLLGRPNVGKSTFVNTVVGQKVSITSPKSQTTRFPIDALYEDERGQLLFTDTPGIFRKTQDKLSKFINEQAMSTLEGDYDVVLYMVDPTRYRDFEEGRVLGIIREIKKPIILVYTKEDVTEPNFISQYRFLEREIKQVFHISALKNRHIKPLLEAIFKLAKRPYPLMSEEEASSIKVRIDKNFVEELVREKIYLFTHKEIPYKTAVRVEEMKERKNGVLYIKAFILTDDIRYKKMLIGREGRMVQEIGMAARKELEIATDKKVYLDVSVVVDPHWRESMFS